MMKTSQNLLFILMATLFLQSCVASKPSNSRKSLSSSVKTTTTTTTTAPTFQSDELLYWFGSEKVTGSITINQNSDSIVYLRGSNAHSFLISKDSLSVDYYRKTYCIVGTYGGSYKQLRLRAVPIYITNYTTKAIERLFRVDVPSRAENASTCGFSTIDGVTPASAAYSLAEICPSCLGTSLITSSLLRLYESNLTTTLTQINTTKISLSAVNLRVDLQSNSTSTGSTCSNSACEAKGFDCCIEGQCVKDATEKANASIDPMYAQAKSDYSINPLNFINYPNIYNICSNISHTPPVVVTPGTTPLSAAQQRVKDYLADYTCIEKVQKNEGYSLCLPASNETQFLLTKKKLAIACGCPTTYTDNERAIKCPDWGVRPLYKSSVEILDNIVDFYCYTPVPANPIGPITNLNVNVSSRSAPHRFYASSGTNYDVLTGLSTTILQEGDDFYYLDDVTKTAPVNGPYNVNSILGRMNVSLSQTQPAKMVTVELGKTYIMSTTSGYYTPCTLCAKDSWFQTFTAHPSTSGGNGLRAAGYTTSRDAYAANSTLGNYEDTKFGRACYLPVTMIPFSHKKNATLQTQRQNRLQTQATYFINGYQRDWFGFNKGAMIGSFDGVTWFAIGTGRRVTATTTKLYLAINASFLDLADRSDTVVNIIPDISASIAADYDFDPSLTITDSKQNQAGTCQQFHQCSTDADCVTQLGWEYSCADMSQLRSHWPVYDTDAKELFNQEKTQTIFEILQGTATIGSSGKRCIYRGSGAPCVRDFTALNGTFNQKALTCAPNFYCAALTTNRFNDEVVRSPNEFDDIFFGMDTNVLGRPLNYVTAAKTLPSEVIANIKYNGASDAMGLTSAQADDMGICRPGKALATTAISAHSNADTSKRTDFISQVSSCVSATSSSDVTLRTLSCPAFDSENNYLPYDDTSSATAKIRAMQNSCGGEARNPSSVSAFKSIEASTLQLLRNISQPTLVLDACLRRAGSVCNTDLDCGPNKMHEEAVGSMALSYFGGTQAEQNYWQESLICGQGTPVPALGSANYKTYKMAENRCCREIGKDFTMFTSGPATIVPENMGTNVALDTKKFSAMNPSATNRYSRYTISKTALDDLTTIPSVSNLTADKTPAKDQWRVINETGSLTCCGGGWVRKFADGSHDWTVKNRLTIETSNFQCLNFRSPIVANDYAGFGDSNDQIVKAAYQREYEFFCKQPSQKGCMQILYRAINGYTILPPKIYEPTDNITPDDVSDVPNWAIAAPYLAANSYNPLPALGSTRLDTGPDGNLTGTYTFKMNQDVPYQPFPYYFTLAPYDLFTFTDGSKAPLSFFANKDTDYGVSMYLPVYIPYNMGSNTPMFSNIYIKYYYDDNNDETADRFEVVNITNLRETSATVCDKVANYAAGQSGQPIDELRVNTGLPATNVVNQYEKWCVSANSKTQNRPMINIKAYTGAATDRQWIYASVIIDFQPLEKQKSLKVTNPGNAYYYLTKLGKLELLGIPQITYEPLYCNNNQANLVPGIFSSSIKTRTQFNAQSFVSSYNPIASYDDDGTSETESNNLGNFDNRFTFQDKLAHAAVFSAKDFTCCTPLGKETASGAKCCSGYATTTSGKMICKLPRGTDLNVYFNKFVSSEGVGDTQPGGGLSLGTTATIDEAVSDFNEYTGEPKLRQSTFDRLQDLGKAYCETGVVGNGGSFGAFPPEPFSGYIAPAGVSTTFSFPLSIVDSIIDSDANDVNAGKFPFDNGYRWDHHFYCK